MSAPSRRKKNRRASIRKVYARSGNKVAAADRLIAKAAKKAHDFDYRATAKEYVEMYNLLQGSITPQQIIDAAEKKFGGMFSEKLFLAQLIYLDDVSEMELKKVIFVNAKRPTLPKLKKFFEMVVDSRL